MAAGARDVTQGNSTPATAQSPGSVPEVAERLCALGWAVVACCQPTSGGACSAPWHPRPCDRRGKRPVLAYVARRPTLSEIKEIAGRLGAVNLAVLTGELIGIDADSPEAEAEVAALIGNVETPTRERRPGRGRLWLFRRPEGIEVGNRAHFGRSGAVDIRGEGGIVIVPPSVSASGHVYGWVPGRSPWVVEAARLPAALLLLVAPHERSTTDVQIPVGELRPPGRLDFFLRTNSRLRRLWKGEKRKGDTSRSGVDFSVAVLLLDLGLPACEVAAAIALRPDAHSTEPDYLVRTVQAARRGRLPCR